MAGTIAEETGNGVGLTGLAYGAKLMPVRVLNRHGEGQANEIAKGIDFAVSHGANVINMSFNFGCHQKVPSRQTRRCTAPIYDGVVTVASVGNREAERCISAPATAPHVIGVGGITEGACLGRYSLTGKDVDVVAPGGGEPRAGCPSILDRPIYQVTLEARQHRTLRRAWELLRDLDGGSARLGYGSADPRFRCHPEDDTCRDWSRR